MIYISLGINRHNFEIMIGMFNHRPPKRIVLGFHMTILSFAEISLGPGKHTKKQGDFDLVFCVKNLKEKTHARNGCRNGRSNENGPFFAHFLQIHEDFRLVQSTHLARAHHVKSKKYCNIWVQIAAIPYSTSPLDRHSVNQFNGRLRLISLPLRCQTASGDIPFT